MAETELTQQNDRCIVLTEYPYGITTRCNCRCLHCAPKVWTGKPGEITGRKMIDAYERSHYLKHNTINIAGGEPFIKEDINEFIRYLDKNKIPCVITTNGWFTEKIEKLLDELEDCETVRFAVSIDGLGSIHDNIRRLNGIFQRALNSARLIRDRGFDVQINTVLGKQNLDNVEKLDSFFKDEGIRVEYIPRIFMGEEAFDFTTDEIRKMLKYIKYPRGRKYLLSKGKYKIHNCHAGRNSWYIDSDGTVYACWGSYYREDSDKYILGNIKEEGFDEIFESEHKWETVKNVVDKCEGCLLPCDIYREVEIFGMSASLSDEDILILADDLEPVSTLTDYSVDSECWHELEEYKGRPFRWMKGGYSRVYLNVHGKGCRRLIIRYMNGKPDNDVNAMVLTVAINGFQIGEMQCLSGEHAIELDLPHWPNKILDHRLEKIELTVNNTWRPCDYTDSIDNRELGLGIYSVGLV